VVTRIGGRPERRNDPGAMLDDMQRIPQMGDDFAALARGDGAANGL